jgi:4-hydroxy-3-methylbut-2-enyl diphosphate reductase
MENMEINKVEGNEFEAMLDASMEDYGVHPGKLVTGKVIQVDNEGVYISFGYRREGLIAWADWAMDANPEELMGTVNVGDEVEAVVVPGSTTEEFIRLSKIRAEKEAAWKTVQELPEGEKRPATVKVLRVIKARGRDKDSDKPKQVVGLAVAVEGVEGFMPASHVELRHIDDFTPYVGKEMEAEIIEVNAEKKRIVVSRRDLLKAEKAQKHQEWLKLDLFERLSKSKFRMRFQLTDADRRYISEKGMDTIREHAAEIAEQKRKEKAEEARHARKMMMCMMGALTAVMVVMVVVMRVTGAWN